MLWLHFWVSASTEPPITGGLSSGAPWDSWKQSYQGKDIQTDPRPHLHHGVQPQKKWTYEGDPEWTVGQTNAQWIPFRSLHGSSWAAGESVSMPETRVGGSMPESTWAPSTWYGQAQHLNVCLPVLLMGIRWANCQCNSVHGCPGVAKEPGLHPCTS